MNPTTDLDVDDSRWLPCESGTLSAFAASDKRRRQNRFLAKVGGVSVLLLLGTLGYMTIVPHQAIENESAQGMLFGGVTCSEVHANEIAYRSGDISPELKQKISVHLRECSHCRSFMLPIEEQVFRIDTKDRLVVAGL